MRQIIVFRGSLFLRGQPCFAPLGRYGDPCFGAAERRRAKILPVQQGMGPFGSTLCKRAIVVELNPFVAILLTLLFFIVRYSSHTFSIYICFCESGLLRE